MNQKQRDQINKEQINRFFASYYSEWRHIKILSNIQILETKYDFYSDIVDEIKRTDKFVGDKTIAQEITNGLRFDSIQQSIQYIEDLFALIYAGKNKDFFIRNIISYDAGKVGNLIKNFKLDRENICKSFYFPNFQMEDNLSQNEQDTLKVIYESVDRLIVLVKELIDFYKKNLFFYNQYKHGLSIAFKTKRCMHIFINNILEVVSQKETIKLKMPANGDNEVYDFDIKFDEVNFK